jgi:hypothetical protein
MVASVNVSEFIIFHDWSEREADVAGLEIAAGIKWGYQ